MKKFILSFFLLIICFCQTIQSQDSYQQITLSDSAQISLLTNAPWDEAIYSIFGHTSVRVNDPVRKLDYVFDFGIFNMRKDNFILLFVKGETDYMVVASEYQNYLENRKEDGIGVVEQIFNLTQDEKQNIFDALAINTLPENRVYRYNYFYDNCSTRPRDIIEKYIKGKLIYTPTEKEQTYRDLVHECDSPNPWMRFGIDLVIGADADKQITDRQKDFLPEYLMRSYEGAFVKSDTSNINRSVLISTTTLLEPKPFSENFPITPLYAGLILLVITIVISFISYKNKTFTISRIFDTLLFLSAGLGGCIIFFLMFFSIHPCTSPNWNIIWLNPLQLIVAFLFFAKSLSKYVYYYHFINFVALLAFLLAWCLIPQQLEIAFIPFIISISIRSLMNILQQKKSKKKADYSLPRTR
ncbi:MAG: DUF4105 domain-containing protein [Dysgonomonas sp.]